MLLALILFLINFGSIGIPEQFIIDIKQVSVSKYLYVDVLLKEDNFPTIIVTKKKSFVLHTSLDSLYSYTKNHIAGIDDYFPP